MSAESERHRIAAERKELRDRFAAAALPGIVGDVPYVALKGNTVAHHEIAKIALSIGEQMLEESFRRYANDLK